MQVYLHIGQGRTGTTTLQSLLTTNREALLGLGYDYPKVGLLHPETGLAQHKLAFSLMPEWPPASIKGKVEAADVWGELRRHMNALDTAHAKLILSSESFMHVPPDGLRFIQRTLEGHDVKVICVTRDAAQARQSWYSHNVMQGAVIDAPTGPVKDRATPRIKRWSRFFNVTQIAYGADVLRDVMEFVGVDIAKLAPVPHRNQRYTPDQIALVAKINSMPLEPQSERRIREAITQATGTMPPELEAFITQALKQQMHRAAFNARLMDHLQ